MSLDTAFVDDTAGCGHLDEQKYGERFHSPVLAGSLWDSEFAIVLTVTHDQERQPRQVVVQCEHPQRGRCWARTRQNPAGHEC